MAGIARGLEPLDMLHIVSYRAIIQPQQEAILELINKFIRMDKVARQRVQPAPRREVAVKTRITPHEVFQSPAGFNGSPWITIFFRGGEFPADLAPEPRAMTEQFQVGKFGKRFLQTGKANLINQTIAVDLGRDRVKSHRETDFLAGFEQREHGRIVPIPPAPCNRVPGIVQGEM
jgi:hypothetical protein